MGIYGGEKTVIMGVKVPPDVEQSYTGRGDDPGPPIVIGAGQAIQIKIAAQAPAAVYTVEFEILGVGGYYPTGMALEWRNEAGTTDGWGGDDELSAYARIPATVVTPNGGGIGNCDLQDIGDGNNMIIPADGDGSHDVALTDASPLPADDHADWVVNEKTGVITAAAGHQSAPYDRGCMLFDFEPPTPPFINRVGMTSTAGRFADTMGDDGWISCKWKIVIKVDKKVVPATACELCGVMSLYRWEDESGP